MAKENGPTFEEINRRIEAADLAGFDVAAARAGQLGQVCDIWRLVGPIVRALADFPLLPPKWREVLKRFCEIMDRICPTG